MTRSDAAPQATIEHPGERRDPDTVVPLALVDRTQVDLVGGKAAHLGELARIPGVEVPPGFCVTTAAFRRVMAAADVDEVLDRLAGVAPDDRDAIAALSARVRDAVEDVGVPDDVATAITAALAGFGDGVGCAVRSSATAEDLPTASFAGQQDSYLNVVGPAAVVEHVSRCWASLFTDRAVAYRLRHGIDHRAAHMAVVVQRMVDPQASGVAFTADPVSGNRRVVSVEAVLGLGEALVSGGASADVHTLRDGEVVAETIAAKSHAVVAVPGGGTAARPVDPARRTRPALTRARVVELAQLCRRIEAHFGVPQDVEWCLVDDGFRVVQSRPITTLFPVPEVDDDEPHVYVSVGHQQMMTEPMKPLGLSVWQLTSRAPMRVAGGRLFVEVTSALASPATRAGLIAGLGRSDPLIGDALQTVVDRGDLLPPPPEGPAAGPPAGPPPGAPPEPIETDPAIVAELIADAQAAVDAAARDVDGKEGAALLDAIADDIGRMRSVLFHPRSHQAIMAGIEAAWWLNDNLAEWLADRNAADALTLAAPNNVTSEMGLALLDVADAVRPCPEVVEFLRGVDDDGFLDDLPGLAGGEEAAGAIRAFLDVYGRRCVGEIDITRPRWIEQPSALVPVILRNVDGFAPGEAARRVEVGRRRAAEAARDVLARLRALPDGDAKAAGTERMIDRLRTFIGYREHPKYAMVGHYLVYRRALLAEAERLVRAGVLHEAGDIDFLTFPELRDVVRTGRADDGLIRRRKAEFASYHALTPPRVLTSDGEAIAGAYRRGDLPPGALIGLAVSAGTVEGRARVVLDMADAHVEPGDILVTPHTDPSWSPLFVAVAGLVTEVGGQMTHGAVVAREYGLPAVVGVEHATQLIEDGQRIRVHGTEGYVEVVAAA